MHIETVDQAIDYLLESFEVDDDEHRHLARRVIIMVLKMVGSP